MFSLKFWMVFLLLLWIVILWTRRKYYLFALKVPGQLGYPLIGQTYSLRHREKVLYALEGFYKKYGTFMLIWMGPIPLFIVGDPQCAQDILTSPHCVNKTFSYTAFESSVGIALINQNEPEWGVHRKLLNPAFGHKMLLSFLPIFNRETGGLLHQLDTMVDHAAVNFIPIMHKFAFTAAAQTTLGSDVRNDDDFKDNKVLKAYKYLMGTSANMVLFPWLSYKIVRQLYGIEKIYATNVKFIRNFTSKIIAKKLAKINNDNNNNNNNEDDDFNENYKSNKISINVAIEQMKRGAFNLKNVEDHLSTIVTAAFETTGNVLANTLILLAIFPEYQQKAFEEIKDIFPDKGDFEVTYEDIQKMVYLDMVLNESMRVLPPVPLVLRQVSQKVELSNGIVLPEGLQVALDIFHMHRSKDIWGPNAETFDPEHFLPINLEEKHPYSFIPFTKGIRNCIGWRYALISIKTALPKIIRNFKFSTESKLEDLIFVENITLEFKPTPLLRVHRRI